MPGKAFLITAAAFYGLITSSIAASQNPFLPYLFQNGGCTVAIGYGHPSIIGKKFLGKLMEDWDANDIRLFKEAVQECVRLSGRRETNGPSVYIDNMLGEVNEARAIKRQRERQAEAKKQAETQEADQRRIDEATSEINTFYNHVMSPAEVDRAEQLKMDYPTLAAKIDGLLLSQKHLKEQADQESKLAKERAEAARKLGIERNKRELAAQLAAEEAKIAAENKQREFEKGLPDPCKKAQSLEEELQSKPMRDKIDRASSLAMAGDTQSACPSLVDLSSKMENIRLNLIKCTKELENNSDELAQRTASTALTDAITVHGKQIDLANQLKNLKCE